MKTHQRYNDKRQEGLKHESVYPVGILSGVRVYVDHNMEPGRVLRGRKSNGIHSEFLIVASDVYAALSDQANFMYNAPSESV